MNKYNNKNYSKKYLWSKNFYRNVFLHRKFFFIYIYKYMYNYLYYYYYFYLYIIIIIINKLYYIIYNYI